MLTYNCSILELLLGKWQFSPGNNLVKCLECNVLPAVGTLSKPHSQPFNQLHQTQDQLSQLPHKKTCLLEVVEEKKDFLDQTDSFKRID